MGEEQKDGDMCLPYPTAQQIKIPGVVFGEKFGFGPHLESLIDRVRIRQNALKKLGGSTWGAETNKMRVTHKAQIESVISCGLVAVGSGAWESDIHRLDTCARNPAARSASVASFSGRLIVLHSVAGAASVHKLYIQQCARLFDLALRALNSAISPRRRERFGDIYGIPGWGATEP